MDVRTTLPDNVYYTLTSTNRTDDPIRPVFSNNNGNDIVSNPMMYYLLISKFVLPNNSLPIFYFDNKDDKFYYKRDPGNSIKFLIEGRTADYRGDLVDLDSQPINGLYKAMPIYYINQFVDMVNFSFQRAALVPDFVLVSLVDGRFQINSTLPYLEFSPALMRLFPTLEATFIKATKTYSITLRDDPANPGNYIAVQEFKSLFAFSDIRSILLLSPNLPISAQGFTTTDSSTQREKVLNDFIPILDENSGVDKSPWIFESNEYRPIDMISQEGFSNFTFDVRVLKKDGSVLNYYLLPTETATVTFRFVKRALFNNEYNLARVDDRIKQNPNYQYHKRY